MKNDRHATTEVNCEVCGNLFTARTERVEKGLGRFCSKTCFDIEQRKRREGFYGRKDLARFYNVGGRLAARWYDENGKTCSTPYPRWWWEMNVGEVPDGMIVLTKDPLSLDPSNFELGTKSDALRKGNATRKVDPKRWSEYRNNLSKSQMGHGFTDETKKKMSESRINNPLASGENHWKWRGGSMKRYPKEFYRVRNLVLDRDESKCQICGKNLLKMQNVHHIDGDKENNDMNNLITLCSTCHNKVHSTAKESPPIMELRSELHWNNDIKNKLGE